MSSHLFSLIIIDSWVGPARRVSKNMTYSKYPASATLATVAWPVHDHLMATVWQSKLHRTLLFQHGLYNSLHWCLPDITLSLLPTHLARIWESEHERHEFTSTAPTKYLRARKFLEVCSRTTQVWWGLSTQTRSIGANHNCLYLIEYVLKRLNACAGTIPFDHVFLVWLITTGFI